MILVLGRVHQRHPDLEDSEVLSAWGNRVCTQYRLDYDKPCKVAVGISKGGKTIEMIAFDDEGDTVIFHALSPPTKKLLKEMGLLP